MSAAYLLPHPTSGIDPTSLPIGPREAFVLSQVDGVATVADLSLGTGLDEPVVNEILVRLEGLGAIRFGVPLSPRNSPRSGAPSGTGSSSTRMRAVIQESPLSQSHANQTADRDREETLTRAIQGRPRYDEALLDEPADISREMKADILEQHARLARASHYELLGVAEDADKKSIKTAYFERVSVFHADRFFGKELGTYKARIEQIFSALTKAHDTLTRSALRAQYDRYLSSRRATRGVRDSLPPSASPARGSARSNLAPSTPAGAAEFDLEIPKAPRPPTIDRALDAFDDASSPLELEPSSTPPLELEPSVPPGPPNEGQPSLGASALRTPDPAAARRLLAKKFGHRTPQAVPSQSPAPDKEEVKKVISEQLRARYDARQPQLGQQIERYVEMAKEARGRREWGSALNSLRVALSTAPGDPRVTELLEEIQEEADRTMADQFIEQARYEEADGHLERAARSYERAARGKSGASEMERAAPLYERAAACLLATRGDSRKIVELARLAVTLDSKRVSAHLLLAQAYEKAGMLTSALGEVSRALELDPKNEEAKQLQKQLK